MYLLDTDTIIYLIKHRPVSVAERLKALDDGAALGMSFVTYAELLQGIEGSDSPDRTRRALSGLVRQIPVVYGVTRQLCEHYAKQSHRLREAGTPIGANDLWIASHALALEATLVTNNLREFERIEGLSCESWV